MGIRMALRVERIGQCGLVSAAFLLLASCSGQTWWQTPLVPPVPRPTPTPEQTATPPPARPTPTDEPKSACPLPPGVGEDKTKCTRLKSGSLIVIMENAVEETRLEDPGAYPWDTCCGYRVTAQQLDEFFVKVVDKINASGKVCAVRDGLELAVKDTNAFSEQYKFWVTSGHLRLGSASYRATCTPAWF